MKEAAQRLQGACQAAGLDLAAAARVGDYNRAVAAANALDDLGDPGHLVVVIGNTRALWPRFCEALRRDPARLDSADPLDRWVEEVVRSAAAELGASHAISFAHDLERVVAIQRLAHLAGLAFLAPSHLSIHPIYGPWVALRAAVVVAAPGPRARPARDPCDQCTAHCLPRLRAAAAAPPSPEGWRTWLAVRDACPVGQEHRYSEAQLTYHYTKDASLLQREAAASPK